MHAMFQMMGTTIWANPWIIMLIVLVLIVFYFIIARKLFVKAHHKWYESLISGHNAYVIVTTMAGKQGRYYFLFLIPLVLTNLPLFLGMQNLQVIAASWFIGGLGFLLLYIDLTCSLAKKFNKKMRFTAGLILLPFIFYPILALDSSTFKK